MSAKKNLRIVVLFASFLMALTVLPVVTGTARAFAEELWLGETQIDVAAGGNYLDGKASYDPETKTLTLDNPAVGGAHENSKLYVSDIDLTVTGSATLGAAADYVRAGIKSVGGMLTLKDSAITCKGALFGIDVDRDVTIDGGTVVVESDRIGIQVLDVSGSQPKGTVIVKDASLNMKTGKPDDIQGTYTGIGIHGGINTQNAEVTITAVNYGKGIFAEHGSVNVDGGKLKVTGDLYGIQTDASNTVSINNATAEISGWWGVKSAGDISIGNSTVSVTALNDNETRVDGTLSDAWVQSYGLYAPSTPGYFGQGHITINRSIVTVAATNKTKLTMGQDNPDLNVCARGLQAGVSIDIKDSTVTTAGTNDSSAEGGTVNQEAHGLQTANLKVESSKLEAIANGGHATDAISVAWNGDFIIESPCGITLPTNCVRSGNTIYESDGTTVAKHVIIWDGVEYKTVTYKVEHGTWVDGTTTDKTESVRGNLKPAHVPTGMIADKGYAGGAWDPSPDMAITENIAFTYAFDPQEYNVAVDSIQHGTVDVDVEKAKYGVTVTVTGVSPDAGYQLKEGSLKYVDGQGNETPIEGNSFSMPDFDVTVTAEFEEIAHSWVQAVQKATPTADGRVYQTCSYCGAEETLQVIYKASGCRLSATAFTYDGKAKTPSVTVSDSNGNAIATEHYDVSYTSNVEPGKAVATVAFKGESYEGSKKLTFTIGKAANTLAVNGKAVKLKAKKLKKKARKLAASKTFKFKDKGQGTVTYKLVSVKKGKKSFKKKFKINAKTGKLTVKKRLKKGVYKVKVKIAAAGDAHHSAATRNVTFKVKVR